MEGCRKITEFKATVDEVFPEFKGKSQHDSHELLAKILDKIEEELPGSISSIFDGEKTSQVTCLVCQGVSIKKDPFRFLPIDIPHQYSFSTTTVHDCIEMTLEKKEKIEYHCENDDCFAVEGEKTTYLSRMPKSLIVQVKRFAHVKHTKIGVISIHTKLVPLL